MNDSELNQLLKGAPVPDPAPEFWERLPRRITAKLNWPSRTEAAMPAGAFRLERLAWALGAAAVCLAITAAVFVAVNRTRDAAGNAVAQAQKCFQEIAALFPNQVRAIVFDERGPRMILAEHADVPTSPPLYLKICGPTGCQRVVTFSGQQIRVNGDMCDVLVDAAGHVLLVGDKIVWSSASASTASHAGPYRIEARPLGASS